MEGTAGQIGLGLGTCGSADLYVQEVVHPSHDLRTGGVGMVFSTCPCDTGTVNFMLLHLRPASMAARAGTQDVPGPS